MTKGEYEGFGYEDLGGGKWRLRLPSGLSGQIEAATEDDVRAKISELIVTAPSREGDR